MEDPRAKGKKGPKRKPRANKVLEDLCEKKEDNKEKDNKTVMTSFFNQMWVVSILEFQNYVRDVHLDLIQ